MLVSAIVLSFAMLVSKSVAATTDAVPAPTMAPVTGIRALPAPLILSPIPLIFSPTSLTFCPASCISCATAPPNSWAAFLAASKDSFASISSRLKASILLWSMTPSLNCCLTSFSAAFRLSSLVLLSSTAPANSRCFWASNLTLLGSSFSSFSTSFSSFWVFFICLLTPLSALLKPVVSPPICTVMPLMRSAMSTTSSFYKNRDVSTLDTSLLKPVKIFLRGAVAVLLVVVGPLDEHVVHHAHRHPGQVVPAQAQFCAAQHKRGPGLFTHRRSYFFLALAVVCWFPAHNSRMWGITA